MENTDTKTIENTDTVNTIYPAPSLPAGTIVMWYGDEKDIPDGWYLCDGKHEIQINGKSMTIPDLRNRFIVAAGSGSNYSTRSSGNYDNPSHSHKVYINPPSKSFYTNWSGSHAHKLPAHWYSRGLGGGDYAGIDTKSKELGGQYDYETNVTTQSAGDHSHSVTVDIPSFTAYTEDAPLNQEIRPRWYALCFIIKR